MPVFETLLTAQVVKPFIESVTTLFGPGVASRAHRRMIFAEEQAAVSQLQRHLEQLGADQRVRDADLHRALRENRERSMDQRYPLGHPGALRDHLPSGLVPCLLVSPIESEAAGSALAAADLSRDTVSRVDSTAQFLYTVSGAFARDGGRPRPIEGNIGAAEIAKLEFDPKPSIIVYFSRVAGSCTAYALVSNLFPTVDGASAFETPVARVDGDSFELAVWRQEADEMGLEWVKADPVSTNPWLSIGAATALFALTISSVYWRLHGVRWNALDSVQEPLRPIFTPLPEATADLAQDRVRAERLNLELAELTARHVDVEVVETPGSSEVLIHVALPRRTVAFFLSSDYPTAPPGIFVSENGAEPQPITLSVDRWEPSHSLAELLEPLS